ncbi:hypothetical protein [Rufibacter radiotolerans]|uniref:hypothetical protein n=1 Tax=Rufibacter radiotolerans TaxID=1379910 RepID=UPI0006647768|nr:hypothetical protein [Rufibacter radiotolerans]
MNIHSKRNWLLVALLNLVVVAFLGLLLRWMFVAPVAGLNYKFLLHAHSHVALLGWLYSALFVGLLVAYLPPELQHKRTYTWQFWLSQGAVLGMLLTFPVQGYAAASITFSSAHILLSYWFIYRFLKDVKSVPAIQQKHPVSLRFVKAALFFLALSSLGPWAMGPIMATGRTFSELYYNAIYFYLHFQYNGWFTFAVLGLVFWLLERHQITFPVKTSNPFFLQMFWSCLPAYLLSVLWTKPDIAVFLAGGASALVQVAALGLFLRMLWPARRQILALFGPWGRGLVLLALLAFTLKTIMQLLTAFPYMADLAFKLRFFIIGYLHLVLIGFISLFVFAFFTQLGWLSFRKTVSRWGMGLFLFAFVGTEALLFLQGTLFWLGLGNIPHFYEGMFGLSVLLPVGILLFFLAQLRGKEVRVEESESQVRQVQVHP